MSLGLAGETPGCFLPDYLLTGCMIDLGEFTVHLLIVYWLVIFMIL